VSPGHASSAFTAWDIWNVFTGELGLDPFPQAFPEKYHSYKSLQSKFIVANYLPVAVQSRLDWLKIAYSKLPKGSLMWMGAKDPCLNSVHQIDFQLQRMIKIWNSCDPAPHLHQANPHSGHQMHSLIVAALCPN
jgi:hypothetical protein